jgi:hypothetical protein
MAGSASSFRASAGLQPQRPHGGQELRAISGLNLQKWMRNPGPVPIRKGHSFLGDGSPAVCNAVERLARELDLRQQALGLNCVIVDG